MVSVDRMGNIFARRPGRNNDLPAVVTGSHLDTQPHGGKFDGVYGVLAGLEVIRTLNDHDVVNRSAHRGLGLDKRGRQSVRPFDDRQWCFCR